MTRLLLVALVLVVGTLCGDAWAVEEEARSAGPTVESLIDPAETEDYAEHVTCIELRRIRRTKVLDYRRMLFYMRDETIYLNQLESPCEQLTDRRITSFKTALGGRLCKMDRLEVLHDLLIPEYRARGRTDYQILSWCFVGGFEPVTPAQAEFLRSESTESGRRIIDVIRGESSAEDPQ